MVTRQPQYYPGEADAVKAVMDAYWHSGISNTTPHRSSTYQNTYYDDPAIKARIAKKVAGTVAGNVNQQGYSNIIAFTQSLKDAMFDLPDSITPELIDETLRKIQEHRSMMNLRALSEPVAAKVTEQLDKLEGFLSECYTKLKAAMEEKGDEGWGDFINPAIYSVIKEYRDKINPFLNTTMRAMAKKPTNWLNPAVYLQAAIDDIMNKQLPRYQALEGATDIPKLRKDFGKLLGYTAAWIQKASGDLMNTQNSAAQQVILPKLVDMNQQVAALISVYVTMPENKLLAGVKRMSRLHEQLARAYQSGIRQYA